MMRIPFRLKLLFCVLLLSIISVPGYSQRFEEGVNLYEQGDFEQAIAIFKQDTSAKAKLFLGKSYFSLGRYLEASSALHSVGPYAAQPVKLEALYTSALTDFQLKQFGSSLTKLVQITGPDRQVQTQLINDARQFYQDVLNYLTLAQRKNAFQEVSSNKIKYDLISSVIGKVDYPTAKTLMRQLDKAVPADFKSNERSQLNRSLADSLSYSRQSVFSQKLHAPKGIAYNIGVILPKYNMDDRRFPVSQGLFMGYTLAAESFNQRNTNKKVFIRYKDSNNDSLSARDLMTGLVWDSEVDAVLGPLYSEPAKQIAALAEQYQVTMLAPLANSDTLNIDNPYVYQANPTFRSHGKKMADYAVRTLGMDTLAVIGERNSLGAASAYAFRDEAEKLGAKVAYFFVEDLESKGYEVTDYTKYFTPDSVLIDSLHYAHVDGVYAPFTGQAAPTLIDLLLIDLEAMRSNVVVLGSQEWGTVNIPENRLKDRTIYFSESYYSDTESNQMTQFTTAFQNRFGIEPNRFAKIGYDAATFLMKTLERVQNPALLKNGLKQEPVYHGLISNIFFNGTHVNQEVKILRLSDQGTKPVGN